MASRFSRLKYALKAIQDPTGTSNNEPPANSIAGNFRNFRDGRSVVNYTRSEESKPGSLAPIAIHPFHTPFDTDSPALTSISSRVNQFEPIATVRSSANIITSPPDGALELKRFIPAKAIVSIGSGAAAVSTVSQITGVRYDKRDAPSYTVPFGQAVGELYEAEVRAAILTAVNAITGDTNVSFDSEVVG